MLYGIDVSKHQTSSVFDSNLLNCDGFRHHDFAIIKATEGYTYTDNKAEEHINTAKENKMLIGVYHFARPDMHSFVNNARDEAKNFIQFVSKHELIGNAVFALDIEMMYTDLDDIDEWALSFLDTVYNETGVRPLLYTSLAGIGVFKKVANNNYGLWVARYNGRKPTIVTPWDFCAIWQKRGDPLDLDIFYGDKESWGAYCKSEKKVEETKADVINVSRETLKQIRDIIDNILK